MTTRQRLLLQAAVLTALVWAGVFGVQAYADSKLVTPEKISRKINAFPPAGTHPEDSGARDKQIRDIAAMYDRLDFDARKEMRSEQLDEKMFRLLNPREQKLFVQLTIDKAMAPLLDALDKMSPEDRRKLVEDAFRDLGESPLAQSLMRLSADDHQILEHVSKKGVRDYFSHVSPEAKLGLAPLLDEMDLRLKGFHRKGF